MAQTANMTVNIDLRWKDGKQITGETWNRMIDALEQLERRAEPEQTQGVMAAAVGMGLALAGSPRRLTRRGFLGLK
jgi:hypothetical protein